MSTSTNNDTAKANAERLKAEGNALHMKREYKAAYEKYSQAIKEDPENPILWSNRAATCLAMNRHLDAAGDAQKATTLDPKYAKAWSRLATARHNMNAWVQSINAWKSALACLPTDRPLTDQEKALQVQFQNGLKKAEAASKSSKINTDIVYNVNDMPWKKALALEEELKANAGNHPSSGFVIIGAYMSWNEGVKIMNGQEDRIINGQKYTTGQTGGLETLSNGIMLDPRIFHLPNPDFFDRYNRQTIHESMQYKAWTSEGPKVIQEQALSRLEQSGWDDLRPALSTTIRAWILRDFIVLKLQKVLGNFLEMAIGMIEWGRTVWKDVPQEKRGTIFDDTFLLGVRRLFLSGLIESLGTVGQADTVSDERLQKIQEVANQILDETKDSKPSSYKEDGSNVVEFAFFASFWLYPRGEALAALAWREMRFANRKGLSEAVRQRHYMDAASLYQDAAKCIPKDDELHLTYRVASVEALWFSGAPLSVSLPYAKETVLLIPDVKRIWGGSHAFHRLLDLVDEVEGFADQAQKSVDSGDMSLGHAVRPRRVVNTLFDMHNKVDLNAPSYRPQLFLVDFKSGWERVLTEGYM